MFRIFFILHISGTNFSCNIHTFSYTFGAVRLDETVRTTDFISKIIKNSTVKIYHITDIATVEIIKRYNNMTKSLF